MSEKNYVALNIIVYGKFYVCPPHLRNCFISCWSFISCYSLYYAKALYKKQEKLRAKIEQEILTSFMNMEDLAIDDDKVKISVEQKDGYTVTKIEISSENECFEKLAGYSFHFFLSGYLVLVGGMIELFESRALWFITLLLGVFAPKFLSCIVIYAMGITHFAFCVIRCGWCKLKALFR